VISLAGMTFHQPEYCPRSVGLRRISFELKRGRGQ
jgi:hypothetical protein